ncbi:hypothetical protein LSAT2_032724 [Lamellibrachia satsuma]|nr:hypothetical protein LSAT2_032724 [Lamellibrachia satsuma]
MGCCVATQISAGSVVKCSFPPSLCVPRRVEPRSASQIIEQKGWHVTPMFGLDSCFNGEACKVVSITQGKKQRLNIPLTEKEVFTIMRSWKNIQGKIIETGILMFLRSVVGTGMLMFLGSVVGTGMLVILGYMGTAARLSACACLGR